MKAKNEEKKQTYYMKLLFYESYKQLLKHFYFPCVKMISSSSFNLVHKVVICDAGNYRGFYEELYSKLFLVSKHLPNMGSRRI